jgi:hypothetical protein
MEPEQTPTRIWARDILEFLATLYHSQTAAAASNAAATSAAAVRASDNPFNRW